MTQNEVISRFCTLASRVGSDVYRDEIPHDCFCLEDNDPGSFEFSERILRFMEETINTKIADLCGAPETEAEIRCPACKILDL